MDVLLEISVSSEQRGWLALVVALVCIAWLLFRPKNRKKDPLEKPAFGSLSQQRTVERQMQNILVELSDMARQMSAQLDTRASRLEQLIKQADERIATLRRLESGPTLQRSGPSIDAPESDHSDAAIDAPLPINPRHAEIYMLADQGKSAHEIAAHVGQPSGEIQLILALRRRTG